MIQLFGRDPGAEKPFPGDTDRRKWHELHMPSGTPETVKDFLRMLQHCNREYHFRLVENGRVIAESLFCEDTGWTLQELPGDRDDAVFVAAMALTEDPVRKKALLMQRIANLVQTWVIA